MYALVPVYQQSANRNTKSAKDPSFFLCAFCVEGQPTLRRAALYPHSAPKLISIISPNFSTAFMAGPLNLLLRKLLSVEDSSAKKDSVFFRKANREWSAISAH